MEEYGKFEAQVSVYILKLYSGFILFRHGKTADMTPPRVTWRWTRVNQKAKAEEHGSPITLWQIDGETMKTVRDFIFLGSKITADDDWNHEIKRYSLLGRKAMTNLDSVLKSRSI